MNNSSIETYSREVIDHLFSHLPFQDWPECRQSLSNRLASDEPWMHALPIISCEAAGGNRAAAMPVAAAWTILRHAANLIDDVQDGDLTHITQIIRMEDAISLAIGWIFMGFHLINDPLLSTEKKNSVMVWISQCGFTSAMGQYQEMNQPVTIDQLEAYWRTLISKSGSIYQAGTACGAVVGTSSTKLIEALGDYGTSLGVIRQVIDDCRDVWSDRKAVDKIPTLPMQLRAALVNPGSEKVKRIQKPGEPVTPDSQAEKNIVFTDMGIPEIVAEILQEFRRRALKSLYLLNSSIARDALEEILEHVLIPKRSSS